MDEPARKRRKTNSPEERERQSSPLRKPPRRPSFASPTKASLARNYPNLLRPTSAGRSATSRPSSRGDILARGKQARAFVLGETDIQDNLSKDALEETNEIIASPRRQRRSEAQNATPRAQRVAGQSGALEVQEGEEEELPATPSQRGLEAHDGPRRGVLFSSPSKRPPRMKDHVKKSPLRPKSAAAQDRKDAGQVEDDSANDENTEVAPQKKQPLDPEIEKRKQDKARLERQIAELEAQVTISAEMIANEQRRGADQSLQASERRELT